jgi:hypothetical protein
MAHTYLLFDFGADEEKVQQARHKLEGWKQAFRLDKKLQFKFDRSEPPPEASAEPEKAEKGAKSKSKAKTPSADVAAVQNGEVKLLVRLYFSNHEKLSEERWLKRIPGEEPFKGTSHKLIQEGEPQFQEISTQFDNLD